MAMTKLYAKIRATEADSASDALLRLYKAAGLENDSFLSGAFKELEDLSARLTTAIKKDVANSRLDECDGTRDEAVRNLGTLIQGYAVIPVPEKKEAAKRLDAAFSKYGKKIVNESYASESSLIESLLEDLGAFKSEMKILEGVETLVERLRNAQDEFNAANDAYTVAKSEKGENATEIKKALVAFINERLVPYLGAVRFAEPYTKFASQAETEIKRVNAAADRRSKKGVENNDLTDAE